jgi:PRC-barrel domain
VKTMILVAIVSLVIAAGAADSAAQTAGSTLISKEQLREVATGWSAKKQILRKDVYNEAGEKVGDINDLIVAPSRAFAYAIVGVGGFLGSSRSIPRSRKSCSLLELGHRHRDVMLAHDGTAEIRDSLLTAARSFFNNVVAFMISSTDDCRRWRRIFRAETQ